MNLLIGFPIWIGLGLWGARIAARKGYIPVFGMIVFLIFCVICGPLGLVVFACMPRTKEGREQARIEREIQIELRHSRQTQACPKCGRENSVNTLICPRCEYRVF
jgi:hypothetical protein